MTAPTSPAGTPPTSSALRRWGEAVARRHRLVLLLWVPLLLFAGASYSTLQDRLATPDYTVGGAESARAQQLVSARFPAMGVEQDVLVFRSSRPSRPSTGMPGHRKLVEAVLADLRQQPHVAGVVSPFDPAGGGQLSGDQRVAVALVGINGNASVRAGVAEDLQDRVQRQISGTPVEGYLTGSSPLNNDLAAVEAHDQELAEIIGIPVALGVLFLALGAMVAAVLPVVLALAGVLLCLGILGLLVVPLHLDQFVTVIATMIGLGVGIDYALFVVSRFREELAARTAAGGSTGPSTPEAVREAVGAALHTAGHTVVASGLIVIVALGSMVVIDGHVFREIAIAAGLVVTCAIVANLTLLPATLAWLGPRVNRGRLRRRRSRSATEGGADLDGRWAVWARLVLRHPTRFALPVLLLLLLAAVPLGSLKLGLDLGLAALEDTPSGRGHHIAAAAFGEGSVGPVQLVVCDRRSGLDTADLDGIARLGTALQADTRVAKLASPTDVLDRVVGGHSEGHLRQASTRPEVRTTLSSLIDRGGSCGLMQAVLAVPVDSPAATRFISDVRNTLGPAAFTGTGATVAVGGLTAQYADLSTETSGKLPLVIVIVLVLSFLYLMVVFRSLLLPAKAVVLNLLATAAALGLTVLIFQYGFGERLFGFTSVGTVQAYLPVALFALLFGLSMDYEVFLVRRMQEEWLRTGDNNAAVATSIAATARQITAAAAIMIAVFGSFLIADVLELKQFGFALAVAVLIDATLIRLLLVPAIMGLASAGNWWLPAPLVRLLRPTARRRARHAKPRRPVRDGVRAWQRVSAWRVQSRRDV